MFRWRLQNIFSNMVMFGVQFEEQNVIFFWPYISNASQMTWIKWQEQFHLWHLRWLSSLFSITRRSRLPKNKHKQNERSFPKNKHKQNEKKHLRTVWKENAIQCKFIYLFIFSCIFLSPLLNIQRKVSEPNNSLRGFNRVLWEKHYEIIGIIHKTIYDTKCRGPFDHGIIIIYLSFAFVWVDPLPELWSSTWNWQLSPLHRFPSMVVRSWVAMIALPSQPQSPMSPVEPLSCSHNHWQ